MRKAVFLPAFLLAAACGGPETPAENAAESLEEAADQSTPRAEEVLENRADRVEEMEGVNAQNYVQESMQAAGNAQVGLPAE